jgi:hypothetical protein
MMPLSRPEPDSGDVQRAYALLRRHEVRYLELEGQALIGVWADQDSPIIRAALQIVGWGDLPVRYLDGAGVPDRYKGTRLSMEPVPIAVLHAMEAALEKPWSVRDEMLARVRWYRSLDEWRSEQLRKAFLNRPAPPKREPAEPEIDWKTVGHGYAIYLHWRRWDPAAADAHRNSHKDKQTSYETAWLLDLGISKDAHKLKLLLERVEDRLEELRRLIRCHADPERANAQFIRRFRAALENMREHPSDARDLLTSSQQALRRFTAAFKQLEQEIVGSGSLPLFD